MGFWWIGEVTFPLDDGDESDGEESASGPRSPAHEEPAAAHDLSLIHI